MDPHRQPSDDDDRHLLDELRQLRTERDRLQRQVRLLGAALRTCEAATIASGLSAPRGDEPRECREPRGHHDSPGHPNSGEQPDSGRGQFDDQPVQRSANTVLDDQDWSRLMTPDERNRPSAQN